VRPGARFGIDDHASVSREGPRLLPITVAAIQVVKEG
jgi:hypothetical protein